MKLIDLRAATLSAALGMGVAAPAFATCNIELTIRNASSHPVSFRVNDVQIRSRLGAYDVFAWGPWRRASQGGWFEGNNRLTLSPGETMTDVYSAAALCGDNRELRADYRCQSGPNNGSSFAVQDSLFVNVRREASFPVGGRC